MFSKCKKTRSEVVSFKKSIFTLHASKVFANKVLCRSGPEVERTGTEVRVFKTNYNLIYLCKITAYLGKKEHSLRTARTSKKVIKRKSAPSFKVATSAHDSTTYVVN